MGPLLTLSGRISLNITYGMGKAPHEPMNSINEKLNTGIHCTDVKSTLVVELSSKYVPKMQWLKPVPMNDTIIRIYYY